MAMAPKRFWILSLELATPDETERRVLVEECGYVWHDGVALYHILMIFVKLFLLIVPFFCLIYIWCACSLC
jgi:hypothetical protein